jgi:hypothetical protein
MTNLFVSKYIDSIDIIFTKKPGHSNILSISFIVTHDTFTEIYENVKILMDSKMTKNLNKYIDTIVSEEYDAKRLFKEIITLVNRKHPICDNKNLKLII